MSAAWFDLGAERPTQLPEAAPDAKTRAETLEDMREWSWWSRRMMQDPAVLSAVCVMAASLSDEQVIDAQREIAEVLEREVDRRLRDAD